MTNDDALFGYRQQVFAHALTHHGLSASTARPTTAGAARSSATASRCCAPESAGGRRRQTPWRR